MLDFELREHLHDILKIHVKRHPVTGQAGYHVGYASLERESWSLIVRHQLRPSHIEELREWMNERFENGSADVGADTSGEGHGTDPGGGD